jgi:serine protease inhibitor
MRSKLLVLVIAVTLVVSGCVERQADDGGTPASSDDDRVEVSDDDSSDDHADDDAREPATPPDSAEIDPVADSVSEFGFDMFNGLADIEPDENVITSPYSAAVLLTMLLNGAGGETREAIGHVLHLEDPFDDEINQHHRILAEYLMSADPDVELAIANSLWANEGTPFEDEYMSEMQESLNAQVEEIDLGSPEAVETIDEWVAKHTNDRIEEMAEDLGVPDPNLVLILLNAVYFLGDWTDPFDPDNTQDGIFTTSEGDEVEVPLMTRDDDHLHAQLDGFQALRLPYGDEERFAMDVFLPDEESDLNELRQHLSSETWNEAITSLNETRVNVMIPRFELEYSTESNLNDVLQGLGMEIAYGGESDFTPMSSVDPWLSTVVQKTFIRVDEEGTEAAAVTGGAMVESMPPQFRADRPFLFTISDTETNTILFLGQVTDPTD